MDLTRISHTQLPCIADKLETIIGLSYGVVSRLFRFSTMDDAEGKFKYRYTLIWTFVTAVKMASGSVVLLLVVCTIIAGLFIDAGWKCQKLPKSISSLVPRLDSLGGKEIEWTKGSTGTASAGGIGPSRLRLGQVGRCSSLHIPSYHTPQLRKSAPDPDKFASCFQLAGFLIGVCGREATWRIPKNCGS